METHKTFQDIRLKRRQILKYIIIGVVGLVTFILLLSSALYTVPAGYVGIVTRWGAVQRIVPPGLGAKIPIAEAVHRMSVQTQKDEVEASSASSNLQTVSAIIAVNYRLDGQNASKVYQSIGISYQEKVVAPAIQNAFKSATAKYTAENLIKMREAVRIDAETELQKQLEPYHIIVEIFNII
ncbi:MAG TPA: prohibitin family protein, partial [Brevefilum sp.]